jgi:cardiolipin synthase
MKVLNKNFFKAFYVDTDLTLVSGGEEYFHVLETLIHEAKETVHLQVYIFDEDEAGQRITEALKKAVLREVKVFLVADTYGSFGLSAKFKEELRKAGIQFRFFSPFVSLRGFHFGRRLHHKIAVADSNKALVGGINIANNYLGSKKDLAWFDFAVLVKGDICRDIAYICESIWRKRFTRRPSVKNLNPASEKSIREGKTLARVLMNDGIRKKSQIFRSYRQAFRSAEQYITIVGAYFMPGYTLRKSIREATARGVQVSVVLSKSSDEPVFRLAMNYLYGWLLKYNVKIYEYEPSILHGKAAVADDMWATIGSHDLNFLSTYGLVETNIDIFDKKFSKNFSDYLNAVVREKCRPLTKDHLKTRRFYETGISFLAYQLIRFSQFILINVLTQKEHKT